VIGNIDGKTDKNKWRLPRSKRVLVFWLAGLAIGLYQLLPTLAWDGGSRVKLNIHVTGEGYLPLSEAKITVLDTRHLVFPVGLTDTNGNASLSIRVGAGGSMGLLFKRGRIVINHELQIEKAGYRPIFVPLQDIVGGREWPLSKESFDLSIDMMRERGLEN
jgi:hypothetical protein